MTWFYNSETGAFANESPPAAQYFLLEADLHEGVGWHDYGTQQEMDAAVAANHWPAPTTSPSNPAAGIASHAASSAIGSLTGQLQVSGIAGWFLRGLKMLFGGILIIAGIGKLTGASNQVVTLASKVVPA